MYRYIRFPLTHKRERMCIAALQLHSADGKTLVSLSLLFCLPLPQQWRLFAMTCINSRRTTPMSLSNFHLYHCHQNTQTITDCVGVLIISAKLHNSRSLTNQLNRRKRLTVTYRNVTHTNGGVRRTMATLLGRHSSENTLWTFLIS
jgi:hypothetical protein